MARSLDRSRCVAASLALSAACAASADAQRTILAIGAHAGDVELTSGALLAKQRRLGDRIVILHLTLGEGGNPRLPSARYADQKRVRHSRPRGYSVPRCCSGHIGMASSLTMTALGATSPTSSAHHGKRVGASGILEPTEAFVDVSPLMQSRVRIFPGEPVFQSPVETIWLGVRQPPDRSKGGPVALEPMSEQDSRGVSPEQVFEVRTEDGTLIDADMLLLQLCAIPEGMDPSEVREKNGLAGSSREIWLVGFATMSAAPNEQESRGDRFRS